MKKQVLLFEEVQKLNELNAEKSEHQVNTGDLDLEAGVSPDNQQPVAPACNIVDYLRDDSQMAVTEKHEVVEEVSKEKPGETVPLGETGTADTGSDAKDQEKVEISEENTEKEASVVNEELISTR